MNENERFSINERDKPFRPGKDKQVVFGFRVKKRRVSLVF